MRLQRLTAPTTIRSGTADVSPPLSPVDLVQDLRRLAPLCDTFNQLGKASIAMLTSKETLP